MVKVMRVQPMTNHQQRRRYSELGSAVNTKCNAVACWPLVSNQRQIAVCGIGVGKLMMKGDHGPTKYM